ncbi:MAG: CARDB domain-containing protein [Pyrobaculum sp.]
MPCTTLVVKAAAPAFSIEYITVNPTEITLGQSTKVTVRIKNTGTASAPATVRVTADGVEIKRHTTADIPAGSYSDVVFDWTPAEAKNYNVCAELV